MAVVSKAQTSLPHAIRHQTEKFIKEFENHKRISLIFSILGIAVMVVCLFATFLWSLSWIIGVFAGISSLMFGMRNFASNTKYLQKLIKGLEGEKKVSDLMEYVLPDTYRIVNDIRVPMNGRTTQIDHVVIGPQGILNIETKNWSVESKETNGRWMIRMGDKVVLKPLDPMRQSKYHEEAIRTLLDKHVDLPQSIYEKLHIQTVVVFTDPDVKVETSSTQNLFVFSNLQDLTEYLHFYQRRSPHLLAVEVEYLTNLFKQTHYKGEKVAASLKVDYSNVPRCEQCGKKVTDKVKAYCLRNTKRFNGKIYCYEHQGER